MFQVLCNAQRRQSQQTPNKQNQKNLHSNFVLQLIEKGILIHLSLNAKDTPWSFGRVILELRVKQT